MILEDYIRHGGENIKMERVMKLHKQMMRWENGTVINGELIDESELSLDNPIWKSYRTQTLYRIRRDGQGSCWDFVNYQHSRFVEWKIPDESYMFIVDLGYPGEMISHSFSIILINGQKYWFEASWKDEAGINPVASFLDVVAKLADHYDSRGNRSYVVYRYNPEGLDRYLTDEKFYSRVSSGELVLEKRRESYHEKSTSIHHSFYRDGESLDPDWISERFRL